MEKQSGTAGAVSSWSRRLRGTKFFAFCQRQKFIVIPMAILICLLPLLGLLGLRNRHGARAEATSPIVYPSPQGYGAGNWSEAYSKAHVLVANMTLREMNNITLGFLDGATGCVGVSGSVSRLKFPGFCLQDAGNGVRNTDGVNGYASGIHIGASWNATLAYHRGRFMGAEFKEKGVNVALGPVVGPIGRIATGGRNWEGFAADPYLTGILAAQSIVGLQESIIASVKHLVAYEQETNRNPIIGGNTPSTSANVDDQTMHEMYMWPFQDAVYAGVGCVMCSYNRINNTYACENSKVMNGILKGELNFQGFVVSDWVAQHSSLPSANAGLDMAMPTSDYWNSGQLAGAVNDGSLNRTRLVDMATRIIATWYHLGQDNPSFPNLGVGMPVDLLETHSYVEAKDTAAKPSLLQQALEGHVLVKNVKNALPLKQPRVLSIFGKDATSQPIYNPGNSWQQNWQMINLTGPELSQIGSNKPLSTAPGTAEGVLTVGGGSGSNAPAYISAPYDAIQERAYQDGTAMWSDFSGTGSNVVASSDACLVFVNEYASEVWDRPSLADADSDALVNSVASQCNNTIVVIHNAGVRLVDAWVENPNITAVLFAHLPGQDAGRAVVQLLYGDVSPSGRLPYTVARQASGYGGLRGPCLADDPSSPQCNFAEGVNIDYRSFLARNVTPRYEFGYGLTYSTFDYSQLSINVNATATDGGVGGMAPVYTNGTSNQNSANSEIGVGGLKSLFESVGEVTAKVANTGTMLAAEVAQLYLLIPDGNVTASNSSVVNTRVLRGFNKVLIAPNETAEVTFLLRRKDVSRWDTAKQAWVVPSGEFQVYAGKSVLDTLLRGSFRT